MVKKIGSIFLGMVSILFCMYVKGSVPLINLRLMDAHGAAVNEVAVGVPFTIELSIVGADNSLQRVAIDDIDQFHPQQQGIMTSLQTVNGVTTTKKTYRYQARSDKKGTFTVGPAHIITQKGTFISEPISVKVLDSVAGGSDTSGIVAVLSADPLQAYVGQKIEVAVRIFAGSGVTLHGLSPLKIKEGVVGEYKGPFTGRALHKGKEAAYQEWRVELLIDKPGSFVIPAVRVDYVIERQSKGTDPLDLFSHFSLFSSLRREYKQVFSNALKLEVEPLPLTDRRVDALGTIENVVAFLSATQALVGEGLVFTLEVEGDVFWDKMKHPVLNLPSGLTYYESKAHVKKRKKGGVKTFEYIVQPTEPGLFSIPSQEVYNFDTLQKIYRTHSTNSLTLKVNGSQVSQGGAYASSQDVVHVRSEPNQNEHEAMAPAGCPLFLGVSTPTPARTQKPIPLYYYFLLGCLGGVILIYRLSSECRVINLLKGNVAYWMRFWRAGCLVLWARAKNDPSRLYGIFSNLCSKSQGESFEVVHERMVARVFEKNGQSPEFIRAWKDFFDQIAASRYSRRIGDNEHLFSQSLYWIKMLKKNRV